jgi:hypothetical protein
VIDPGLALNHVGKGIGAQDLAALPHELPALEMPPGVGVSWLPDGHGKDGHEKYGNQ